MNAVDFLKTDKLIIPSEKIKFKISSDKNQIQKIENSMSTVLQLWRWRLQLQILLGWRLCIEA